MPKILALDTSSANLTVAVAIDGVLRASALAPQRQASAELLPLLSSTLESAQLRLEDLDGLLALCGPGSFTGIRIGLATALGIHQATGLPATTWTTLQVLAVSEPEEGGTTLALIHALRDEWYCQLYSSGTRARPESGPTPTPLEDPRRRTLEDLAALDFGRAVSADAARVSDLPFEPRLVHSPAAEAARCASREAPAWDSSALTRPLYLAAPPASLPAAAKPVLPLTP
ncbi:MAG: tRNA (adenosine(37)-N6)-threonylcarbamoyltransferase complex dimerization subunit type 1 TsaB [Thermoanaerobaculia bacterium]|nr:tRNA (adenosine(37)-N6)-threonylcarbamoyltransferase complex dimerization subunit type 1 TsaB [Thermoanaerobaculia bacterium]